MEHYYWDRACTLLREIPSVGHGAEPTAEIEVDGETEIVAAHEVFDRPVMNLTGKRMWWGETEVQVDGFSRKPGPPIWRCSTIPQDGSTVQQLELAPEDLSEIPPSEQDELEQIVGTA